MSLLYRRIFILLFGYSIISFNSSNTARRVMFTADKGEPYIWNGKWYQNETHSKIIRY